MKCASDKKEYQICVLNCGGDAHTEGTIIRGVEGPKVLAPPPTAHTNIFFPSLWAAVYTLGEYKFFHPGFFWNSS